MPPASPAGGNVAAPSTYRPCAICETPGAPAVGLRLCAACASHEVLVAAWREGVLRAAGQAVVLAPRVPVIEYGYAGQDGPDRRFLGESDAQTSQTPTADIRDRDARRQDQSNPSVGGLASDKDRWPASPEAVA